ncbi:MAG TPA: ATP-binding protein [Candidatus Eremiobacteraeota bacterium]|nr:MAG: Sporulation kinase E [bacterium ADurb.Bin363]HPZ10654.1 ATP-binding protein [Candidatus Eremiobacteraeota bacterium]
MLTDRSKDIIIITVTWVIITLLHFFTPVHHRFFHIHEIYRQLYYIPIIYGVFSFGIRGGLIISLSVGIIYFIHITCQWDLSPGEYIVQLLEIVLFIVIAFITGILVEKIRKEQKLYKDASEKLKIAFDEMKEYQKQLIVSERMRSVGELAAGLAHEIKNPLSSIKSSVEVIEGSVNSDSPAGEFLGILLEETERLNKVVNSFLSFARPVKPELLPCKIEEVLEPVIKLLKPELKKNSVTVEKEIEKDLPEIYGDAQQLQQVFLNLSLNAIQAMPEGGRLSVKIMKSEKYIKIDFLDTGVGIPEENMGKLFTPFFSTRKEGNGLGLAISYRIIENHKGEISVESRLSKGSCFSIKIPV